LIPSYLKFPEKVSCGEPHKRDGDGIFDWFTRKWANSLKILVQRISGNQSPDIGKGEMVAAFDRMPPRRRFVEVAGIHPGE
jgi:hypothetical protein